MSWKSRQSCYQVKGEAPMHTSAEFMRTYGALADALSAMLMNAEAGLSWLSAQPPDLEEVRQALNAIANDGKRAGELVVRVRASMEGSSTTMSSFAPLGARRTSSAR